ncbi:hypothetical protein NMG60_11009887 [Bertholletia excelsa]
MAIPLDDQNHSLNTKLYEALVSGDSKAVLEHRQQVPHGPLHRMTVHRSNVLHVATYFKQKDLVLDLLQSLNPGQAEELPSSVNNTGATILHDAAASNKLVSVAAEMLRRSPELLGVRNSNGETALFRAARYGKTRMFQFLDGEVCRLFATKGKEAEEEQRGFYRRDDKTTVLHITVLYRHFDLALLIAKSHEYLVHARDGDEMTPLQLLACSPSAFLSRTVERHIKLIKTCVSIEEIFASGKAAKKGIAEIVEGILNKYPLAIEHIDAKGRSLLHVAVQYREMHIFDLVEKRKAFMRWLLNKIDYNGNSILHMVGIKADDNKVEDMRSPALLLREDLLLYERIQRIADDFHFHRNNNGLTPEELFTINSSKLRSDAKEWLKRTAENCSIVRVLIATVAFAAAYTVPGGMNQETGYPVLLSRSFFIIFTIADVLSLTFALTSVITFLSILTSPFRLMDFKQSLPQKLVLGVTLLILSVSMMMTAFAATIILMMHNEQEWTRVVLYAVALLPVTILVLSYMPLYVSLMKTF